MLICLLCWPAPFYAHYYKAFATDWHSKVSFGANSTCLQFQIEFLIVKHSLCGTYVNVAHDPFQIQRYKFVDLKTRVRHAVQIRMGTIKVDVSQMLQPELVLDLLCVVIR